MAVTRVPPGFSLLGNNGQGDMPDRDVGTVTAIRRQLRSPSGTVFAAGGKPDGTPRTVTTCCWYNVGCDERALPVSHL